MKKPKILSAPSPVAIQSVVYARHSCSTRLVWFLVISVLACTPDKLPAQPEYAYKMPAIADVPTVMEWSVRMALGDRMLRVTLLYQAHDGRPLGRLYQSHPPTFVKRTIRASSYKIDTFLQQRGLKPEDCRGQFYNLIIYVVDESILSDRRRFPDVYGTYTDAAIDFGQTMYGFYSSTPLIERNSTILVTDVGPGLNEEVLAHEMSHYWWDRLCITTQVSETSEEFAQAFDDYYMQRRSP